MLLVNPSNVIFKVYLNAMDLFLKSVAQWLLNNYNSEFSTIALVYPNQRTGVFLTEHLKNLISHPVWMPKGFTINEFAERYSQLQLAENIELLAVLFQQYSKISMVSETFDDFYFWGELMLSDFNDIDKYQVSAQTVLKNVSALKQMENDWEFLTTEQIDALKRFFSNFTVDKNTELKRSFLKVWEILLPVYESFVAELEKNGIGYEGMIYNSALQEIKNKLPNFDFSQVIFVGFNALTPVEEEIFTLLKTHQLAKFCWDYDDYYIKNKIMEAGMFQRQFIDKYPNVIQIPENQLIDKEKNITVISEPTNFAQVLKTAEMVAVIPTQNHSNTAIVLSDEQLLLPLLNNMPNNVKSLNVTMGYPFADSISGNFIDQLINMQLAVKVSDNKNPSFYYKTIMSILRHPFLQTFDTAAAQNLINEIEQQNISNISLDALHEINWKLPVFAYYKTVTEFATFLQQLIHTLLQLIDAHTTSAFHLEKEFLYELYVKHNQLTNKLIEQKIDLKLFTYFRLLRKLMQGMRVAFEGEPVDGLQVMGFLETRNLDFENVIILSVNEGVLPLGSNNPSFIPFGLRHCFGLPTKDLHDAMYAYYFYRIIQRAKNVTLMYNSGSTGNQSGEKSRFLHQLIYDSNFNTRELNPAQVVEVNTNQQITITKDALVFDKLAVYQKGEKWLSPSAISSFIVCPLKFYYKYLAKINEPEQVEDKVDARLFGNIFHKAAEKLYLPFFKQHKPVTLQDINRMKKHDKLLSQVISEAFDEVFLGEKTKRHFNIEGKNHIVFKVIKSYLQQLLHNDTPFVPFTIVGLEVKMGMAIDIPVNGIIQKVHLGGTIDRLDRTEIGLRVIDYKTGNDKLEFDTLESVFSHDHIENTKAIFQTFVYAYMVSHKFSDANILPMIYQVKNLFDDHSQLVISSKSEKAFANKNFVDIKNEVKMHLTSVLTHIFDAKQNFWQTDNKKACIYCPYKVFCGR